MNHVWFGQSLPVDQAQFACDVTAGSGRSWFNGAEGTGELSPDGKGDADDGQRCVVMWFVGAHECGHGVGLNDDYCERWSAHSYGQLSYRWHLPGDPYEPDGRTVEFHEAGGRDDERQPADAEPLFLGRWRSGCAAPPTPPSRSS